MNVLNEYESDKIVSKYVKTIKNKKFSLEELKNLDFKDKIYVKIISENMAHKKKMGAIFNIENKNVLKKEFKKIENKFKKLNGKYIIVQKAIVGEEFILGIKKDFTFGYVLMFGIGGSKAEEIKDVSFRKIKITKKDAIQMIDDLVNQAIILRVNKQKLIDALLKIQKIVSLFEKKGYKELDINPLIVNEKEAIVVDSKIYY